MENIESAKSNKINWMAVGWEFDGSRNQVSESETRRLVHFENLLDGRQVRRRSQIQSELVAVGSLDDQL